LSRLSSSLCRLIVKSSLLQRIVALHVIILRNHSPCAIITLPCREVLWCRTNDSGTVITLPLLQSRMNGRIAAHTVRTQAKLEKVCDRCSSPHQEPAWLFLTCRWRQGGVPRILFGGIETCDEHLKEERRKADTLKS
jgi:hypothetical protein